MTKESAHGQTALMFAAALNRDAVVRVLIAHGAEANAVSSVAKIERVRFDQDGNIVEERPGRRSTGRRGVGDAAEPRRNRPKPVEDKPTRYKTR